METFRLPASDERYLRQTTLEAWEEVMLVRAAREWIDEISRRRNPSHFDDEPDGEIHTDKEAAELASTPRLTGDPEGDAIELSETGPDATDWAAEYEQFLKGKQGV
jgi:hypothetical protein